MDWKSSLTTRVLAASFLAIASTCTLIFAYFMKASRDQAVGQLEQRAAAFVSVADAARAHAATLYEDNVFRSEVLTDELRDIVRNGGDYRSSRIYETIPIVSGWTVARIAAAKEGIDFLRGGLARDAVRWRRAGSRCGGAVWLVGGVSGGLPGLEACWLVG